MLLGRLWCIRGSTFNPLFWIGAGMFLIGIVFKLSLVPFHTWTPDVFEGAPLPVTAFMSVATKAGALAVFARFIYAALPSARAERAADYRFGSSRASR